MQEKEYVMNFWCEWKLPSPGITWLAECCRTVALVTAFSICISQPLKLLVILRLKGVHILRCKTLKFCYMFYFSWFQLQFWSSLSVSLSWAVAAVMVAEEDTMWAVITVTMVMVDMVKALALLLPLLLLLLLLQLLLQQQLLLQLLRLLLLLTQIVNNKRINRSFYLEGSVCLYLWRFYQTYHVINDEIHISCNCEHMWPL